VRHRLVRSLLQKATVLLKSVIPAARFHAERLARSATGKAGRDRGPVQAFVAIRNADFLFTAASHGGGERNPAVKQAEQDGCSCDEFAVREHDGVGIGQWSRFKF